MSPLLVGNEPTEAVAEAAEAAPRSNCQNNSHRAVVKRMGQMHFIGEVIGLAMDVLRLSSPTAASVSVGSANSNKIASGGEDCLRSAM